MLAPLVDQGVGIQSKVSCLKHNIFATKEAGCEKCEACEGSDFVTHHIFLLIIRRKGKL